MSAQVCQDIVAEIPLHSWALLVLGLLSEILKDMSINLEGEYEIFFINSYPVFGFLCGTAG